MDSLGGFHPNPYSVLNGGKAIFDLGLQLPTSHTGRLTNTPIILRSSNGSPQPGHLASGALLGLRQIGWQFSGTSCLVNVCVHSANAMKGREGEQSSPCCVEAVSGVHEDILLGTCTQGPRRFFRVIFIFDISCCCCYSQEQL